MASKRRNELPVGAGLIPHEASSTDLPSAVRHGWDDAFRRMAQFQDDRLIDDVKSPTVFDQTEWEW
ncbi:MAG: hypothetical protein H7062_13715 [Candidatus Saccharimonas sp.]|nr:hypothetical protein [Planctomycetaceae bacterium]